MDFGKLSNVDHVNFDLPPLDYKVLEYIRKNKGTAPAKLYIGAPLWGVPSWIGKVYPYGTKAKDYLRNYALQFNTIELNTTHYRIPTKENVTRWKDSVPKDFKFCPKFPQEISHSHMLRGVDELAKIFCNSIEILEENLGVSFLQLPPNLSIRDGSYLKQFIQSLPKNFKLAIEFRHPSWFIDNVVHPKVSDYLSSQSINTVITDVAGRRDVLHMSITGPSLFVRFVGNNLHPSDFTRIHEWTNIIKRLLSEGLDTVYFFIHQPGDTLIPDLVSYFIDQLSHSQIIISKKPEIINEPQQINLI